MRGSARHQLCKCLRTSQASSLHQGDVLEEEVQEEEWSDAGRHPSRHFPAANVIQPNHIIDTLWYLATLLLKVRVNQLSLIRFKLGQT